MDELGLLQIYTGDGKGKTTASLGLSLRAVGNGFKVLFIQFMKGQADTGELMASRKFGEAFVIEQYGSGEFIWNRKPTAEEFELAGRALERAKQALTTKTVDLLVLDEISHAINMELIDLDDVLHMLTNRPVGVEIVLTGRNMPVKLLELADLVSEIHPTKHPWEQGVSARRGIEY